MRAHGGEEPPPETAAPPLKALGVGKRQGGKYIESVGRRPGEHTKLQLRSGLENGPTAAALRFHQFNRNSLLQNRDLRRGQSAHPSASIMLRSHVSTVYGFIHAPALRSACLCYRFPCACVFFVVAVLFTRTSDLHGGCVTLCEEKKKVPGAVVAHFSGTATVLALQRGDGRVQWWDCCISSLPANVRRCW